MWRALAIAWQLGYMIALPLVLFAIGGRIIDQKFHTAPWGMLLAMLLAILATGFWLYQKMSDLRNQL